MISGLLFLPAAGVSLGGLWRSDFGYNFLASRTARDNEQVRGWDFRTSYFSSEAYYPRFRGGVVRLVCLAQ